jgi:tetratricopeptide (TPR) repeat protein
MERASSLQSQFSQIHLFLDESGSLAGQGSDNDLVGGLVLFGPYDASRDEKLRQVLRDSLASQGGRFPGDLHSSSNRFSKRRQRRFQRDLRERLEILREQSWEVHAVAIRHRSDVFRDEISLVSEAEADNRYLSMLWALVEHLLYLDPGCRQRLAPDAVVHLHIANRAFVFPWDEERKKDLEQLGYSVRVDRHSEHQLVICRSLNEREVLAMFRQSLKLRWRYSALRLASVETPSIDYNRPVTVAGLYLADIALSQIRSRASIDERCLPLLCELEYAPWLVSLKRVEAGLRRGSLEDYLKALGRIEPGGQERADVQEILDRQRQEAETLLAADPSYAEGLLARGLELIDRPGGAEEGKRLANLAHRALLETARSGPLLEARLLQGLLSAANHRGDVEDADELWEAYLELEPDLITSGQEGIRLRLEIRNRRAVSLMDHFRHNEAIALLEELAHSREVTLEASTVPLGIQLEAVPDRLLGACLGSLGQAYAFRRREGDDAKAEACFRQALGRFRDRLDRERQWVYLGHLACDRGSEAGKALRDEVSSHLSELDEAEPLCVGGGQFRLVLQAKCHLVFSVEEEVRRFLDRWDQKRPLEFYREASREHPFGLLLQTLGMLWARLAKGELDPLAEEAARGRALRFLNQAQIHMCAHGSLLEVLGVAARLRGDCLKWELSSEGHSSGNFRAGCRASFTMLQGLLRSGFGEAAWGEDEEDRSAGYFGHFDPGRPHSYLERSRAVLQGFRFNFR